jgi:hypothetical protein
MERELSTWIETKRSAVCCVGGFVIRLKAMEIIQEHCERNNIPCNFKASVGWLLNLLRRITTTGRDLPENSIETILKFLIDMRKLFIDIEASSFDLDSLINMDDLQLIALQLLVENSLFICL